MVFLTSSTNDNDNMYSKRLRHRFVAFSGLHGVTTPNEAKSQHQTNQPKPASQQPATSNQHTGHWQPTNTEEAKMLLDRSCCWTDGGQAMTSSMSTIAKLSKKKQFLSMVFTFSRFTCTLIG